MINGAVNQLAVSNSELSVSLLVSDNLILNLLTASLPVVVSPAVPDIVKHLLDVYEFDLHVG
jgi:hypothetical protein